MKPETMTKGDLLAYNNEIHSMQQRRSAIGFLLKPKIKDFYATYSERIKSIDNDMRSMQANYFEREEDGTVKMIHEEGKPSVPTMRPNMKLEDFKADFAAFMDQQLAEKVEPFTAVFEIERLDCLVKNPEAVEETKEATPSNPSEGLTAVKEETTTPSEEALKITEEMQPTETPTELTEETTAPPVE